eukprot:CFRG5101T1
MANINAEWSGLSVLDAASIPDKCVHELFMDTAAKHPDLPACSFENDKLSTLTYKQLDICSNRIANHLKDLGAKPDDMIGVCLSRSTSLLASMLGIMKSGAAYVALDPKFPPERLAFVIEEADIRHVLCERDLEPFLDEVITLMTTKETSQNTEEVIEGNWVEDIRTTTVKRRMYNLKKILATQFVDPDRARKETPLGSVEWGEEIREKFDEEYHGSDVKNTNLAYCIYTSGSTGKPKGVLLPHRGVVNFLLAMQEKPGFKQGQTLLAMTTICFDISVLELFLPLIAGGMVIICSAQTQRDGGNLKELIEHTKPDVIQATPATWSILVECGWNGRTGLKILCGGEPLAVSLANRLTPIVAELWNMYGPTEVTVWCTVKLVKGILNNPPTIGRPIKNTTAYILDMESNEPVESGRQGKLFLGGEQNARGYNKRPDTTAEKFVHDPFRTDVENPIMYDSGDLAKFNEEGEIVCCGRSDYQVKINGFRIELGEIESALDRHESLKANIVVVAEIAGNKQLVAYVVAKTTRLDIADLKTHVEQCCTPYMVPGIFIQLHALPLLPNGKVNRHALPKPDDAKAEMADQQLEPPETPHEREILAMCQILLGVNHISTTINLFSIGGNSLFAVKLHNSIKSKFAVDVPVATILIMPTIREIAGEVKGQCESDDSEPKGHSYCVPLCRTGNKPMLILFHPAGGFVFPYFSLVKAFGTDQPISGIQGNVKEDPSLTSIELLAKKYVEEIMKILPDGPFLFAGWSMGGFLALEAAIQLTAMGKNVLMVALIDQPPKEHGYSRGYFLFESITKGKHMFRQQLALKNDKLKGGNSTFAKGFYKVLAKVSGADSVTIDQPNESVNKDVLIDPSAGEALANLDFHMKMCTRYMPHNYNGNVLILRANENVNTYDYMTDWSLYCPKAVIKDISGSHFTCLKDPHASTLSNILTVAMEVVTYKDTNIPREGGDDAVVLGYGEFDPYTMTQSVFVSGRARSGSNKTVGRLKLFAPTATEAGLQDTISLPSLNSPLFPKPDITFESFALVWKKDKDSEEHILVENKQSELKEMKSSARDKGKKFLIQKSITFPRLTVVDCIFKIRATTPVEDLKLVIHVHAGSGLLETVVNTQEILFGDIEAKNEEQLLRFCVFQTDQGDVVRMPVGKYAITSTIFDKHGYVLFRMKGPVKVIEL